MSIDNVYERLLFKYIDRMSDVVESDPADKILREFVSEFWDVQADLDMDPTPK